MQRIKRWEYEVRVLIVPNLSNPTSVVAACELATWLSSTGFEPLLSSDDASGCGLAEFGVAPTEIGEPGLVVALGGDGTIIKAVHLLGYVEAPVLGVNMGHLGFMTGAIAEDLRESVSSALAGEGHVERRSTLEASVVMDGREVGRYRALNEIFLGRGASGRAVEISLSINDSPMMSTTCDGFIVATPTGSTAYGLSAGGPIVSPDVACNIVVPVAPHTLAARPIVMAPSDVVEMRFPHAARSDACISVDGDAKPCRQLIEKVTVYTCDSDVLLLKLDGRQFYDVLSEEFLGG